MHGRRSDLVCATHGLPVSFELERNDHVAEQGLLFWPRTLALSMQDSSKMGHVGSLELNGTLGHSIKRLGGVTLINHVDSRIDEY